MALNKNKVIAAAQRHTQKGQLDRAIQAYKTIVEVDPADVRVWLKIGDLYAKKGARGEAVHAYTRVATHYSERGFFQKAVSVFRRILEIEPSNLAAHSKLAGLYVQLTLIPEAIRTYQLVAGTHEREGRLRECQIILKKIVELAPGSADDRIRLAEAFARQNEQDKAVEEFKHILDVLYERNELDQYVQVAERMLYLSPNEFGTVSQLSEVYLRKGDPKRALGRLQILFRSDPSNVETLELLGTAFADIGQAHKAISVYRELARIYDEQGNSTGRISAWRNVQALAPDDPAAHAALGDVPGEIKSVPSLQRMGPGASMEEVLSDEEQIQRYLGDVDVYLKYELNEHAFERLERIFEIEPGHVEGLIKFKNLAITEGRTTDAIDALLRISDASSVDPEAAMSFLGEILQLQPGHPDASDRMKVLSASVAKKLTGGHRFEGLPSIDAAEDFDVELDLEELELGDEVSSRDRSALSFEVDLNELADPPPDDDAFGDLLADVGASTAIPSSETPEDDFGGLLDDSIPLALPDDDFSGLLDDSAPVIAPPLPDDFGGLLDDSAPIIAPPPPPDDDFGDLLGEMPDFSSPNLGVIGSEFEILADVDADVPDDDEFADLLAGPISPVTDAFTFDEDALDEATDAFTPANNDQLRDLLNADQLKDDSVAPPVRADDFGDLRGRRRSVSGPPAPMAFVGAGSLPPVEASPVPLMPPRAKVPIPAPLPSGGLRPPPLAPRGRPKRVQVTPAPVPKTAPPTGAPGPRTAPPTPAPAPRTVLPTPAPAPRAPIIVPPVVSKPQPSGLFDEPIHDLDVDLSFSGDEPTEALNFPLSPDDDAEEYDINFGDFDEPTVGSSNVGVDLFAAAQSVEKRELEEGNIELFDDDIIELDDDDFQIEDYEEPDSLSGSIAELPRVSPQRRALSVPPPAPAPPVIEVDAFADFADFDDDDHTIMAPLGFEPPFDLTAPLAVEPSVELVADASSDSYDDESMESMDQTVAIDPSALELLNGSIHEEIAELDFLLESNLVDDARELLNDLEQRHPDSLELQIRRQKVEQLELELFDSPLDSMEANMSVSGTAGAKLSELGEADAGTQLDLGVAFKEMGQYKKAIEQLKLAARSTEHRANAMHVLALCHLETGKPDVAVGMIKVALQTPNLTMSRRFGLQYDLATAFEQMGNKPGAIAALKEIVAGGATDFLDVHERLNRLKG